MVRLSQLGLLRLAGADTCDESSFPVDLTGFRFMGLSRGPEAATNEGLCREACCDNDACQVYQFWSSSDPENLPGQCWLGQADSYETDYDGKYISRGRSMPAPPAPSPVPSKGFLVQRDSFWKDGERFNLRSGSLHYFRVPREYWRDRIQRMKALGLNCITMYVAWNYHEELEGQVSKLDEVTGFLDAAKVEGMLVLFRPGPYICGEWEMGGLPAWLLWEDKRGIKLRTYEDTYIAAVDKWMSTLLDAVKDYTYANGGPIALTQIENEYGSFGNCETNPDDAKYMNHLLDLTTSFFGTDMVYTTVDGGEGESPARLESGSPWKGDRRVLATVDGGLDSASVYASGFRNQKEFNAIGYSPKMWSELWVGWFTVWGDANAANKSYSDFHNGVGAMVSQDASYSLYMAHGGTNFGFWSGANGNQTNDYQPDVTSYDYSSPISEAGDHNVGFDGGDLFEAVRSGIAPSLAEPSFLEPPAVPKTSYGSVALTEAASLFGNLEQLSTCNVAVAADAAQLPSFEDLKHNYGLVLYSLDSPVEAMELSIKAEVAHDRVQVFVDDAEAGTAYRPSCPETVAVPSGKSMKLLVENMGRINYGLGIMDYKGYLGAAPAAGNWTARCLPLADEQVQGLSFGAEASSGPVFRRGSLDVAEEPIDTFFDLKGFTKGYVWVNGRNLGRYWETAGPQHTLYVPGPFLRQGANEVIVLDLHGSDAKALASVAAPRYHPESDLRTVIV